MSDIGTPAHSTTTCAACGAMNDTNQASCYACGAQLDGVAADRERPALELEEVWRAVAAAGFADDAELHDDGARCPVCQAIVPIDEVPLGDARAVVDTMSGRDDLVVAAYSCADCGTGLRLLLTESQTSRPAASGMEDTVRGSGEPMPPERAVDDAERTGAAPLTPVQQHPDRFEHGEPGTLSDQGSLIDAEGDDIRQYTGEPVETEDGWVIPQQQNFAGKDNIAGGGEWPDPTTPPTQPRARDRDAAEDDAESTRDPDDGHDTEPADQEEVS